jgi:hypothetical protein
MSALDKQVGGDHYKKLAIQPAVYCHRNKMGGLESAIVKYVTRYQWKAGKQDLEKAIHCLELLIQLEYGDDNDSV